VVENADDPFEGPVDFAVECYGQGETQSISQKAQTDPAALLEYLDRFIDIGPDLDRERSLLDEVLALQSQIEKAGQTVDRIPQVERDLALKKKQLDALEKAKAKEVIALIRKLEAEKQIRISIQNDVKALADAASHEGMKETLKSLKGGGGSCGAAGRQGRIRGDRRRRGRPLRRCRQLGGDVEGRGEKPIGLG
jgi:hypothetical protein